MINKCKICKLLKGKINSDIYYENGDWLILDWSGRPRVIYKKHTSFEYIPTKEIQFMINKCMEICNDFGEKSFYFKPSSEKHFNWYMIFNKNI